MVSESSLRGGGYADGAVDSDKVVMCEPQARSSIVVLPFLAEGVRQAGEAANLHPHREVLALDVRRANLVRVGASDEWDHLRCDHFRGWVAVFAFR